MMPTPEQLKKLRDALVNAFPEKSLFEQLLYFELKRNLNEITTNSNLQDIAFKLIQTAESQGWLEGLVHAARNSNPGNLLLRAISEELLSNQTGSFHDPLMEQQDILNEILSKKDSPGEIDDLCRIILNDDNLIYLRNALFIRESNKTLHQAEDNINIEKIRDIQIGGFEEAKLKEARKIIKDLSKSFLSEDFQEISSNEFQGDYSQKDLISYQHLTGINEYPTLSFLEDDLPQKLKSILNIDNTPIIYRDNSILERLETFAIESGNEDSLYRFKTQYNKRSYTRFNKINNTKARLLSLTPRTVSRNRFRRSNP